MPLLPRRLPLWDLTRSLRRSSSTASSVPPLIGSAPHYPRHLVIHTPHLSETWPSHLESVSSLYKDLGTRWSRSPHDQLKQLGFGVSEGFKSRETGETWDPKRPKFESPPESTEEVYSATLYPDFLHFPSFSLSSLASFETKFLSLPPPSSLATSSSEPEPAMTHIYVCTHGSRDCRCGDLGEKLYQSILSELKRRKLGGELAVEGRRREGEGNDARKGVRVSRISHIGGHKWAANALVYKKGGACDWYGLLNDSDVSSLIDVASSTSSSTEPLYANWRGRLDLTPDETKSRYLSHVSSTSSSTSSSIKKKTKKVGNELGEQISIKFVTHDGEELDLVGYEGESLMQVAKRGDAPSILATCGGNCECATCHVHIPPILATSTGVTEVQTGRQPIPVPDLPSSLPEMTDEEDEQLDFAIGADDDSRLACQIPVTKELGEWVKRGGRIKLPRY